MKKIFLLLFLSLTLLRPASAQYEIQYPKWYPGTKLNHLYILSQDSSTIYSQDIIHIIRSYWTLTAVSVLLTKDGIPENLMVKGNGFLSVTSYSKTYSKGSDQISANDYYHLDIWTVKDLYKPSKEWQDYGFILASAELYNRTIGMGVIAHEAQEDFTAELFPNDFLNGMSGNIKNIIQYFNKMIAENKEINLLQDHESAAELNKLKTDTLFMPNYWYGGKNTMLGEVSETSSDYTRTVKYMNEVVKSYPYKIKFITRAELNDKIIHSTKDLYYVNVVQSSADKLLSVINGFTGDVIYSEVQKKSYRIKNSDLQKIGTAIK